MMVREMVIHTCCADCLINLITFLHEENYISQDSRIILLYYNPNIHPRSEYMERLNAIKIVMKEKYSNWNMKLVVPDYKPKEFFDSVIGQKNRCLGCWTLRIGQLFQYAKENNINYVSSTLLGSSYQDRDTILNIAKKLESENIKILYPQNEHECICNHGFYKQNYCGCCYSLNLKLWEKYIKQPH